MKYYWRVLIFLVVIACEQKKDNDWGSYLGNKSVNQYSNLNQINRENVDQLEVAWTFGLGDADTSNRSQVQCNPLIIDGVLYGSSPSFQFFALDAATGEKKWVFNPFEDSYKMFGAGVNRGLVFHQDENGKRLFFTATSNLYALDAETGKLIESFGNEGVVDLKKGLGRDVDNRLVLSNTPGVIHNDLLILGTRVDEGFRAAPGHVRAYDIRSGEIRWIFHTIPKEGEFGADTWPEGAWETAGGANAWGGMSLDEERGIVYIPTGSASYDFYGGNRHGDNLFANCIIALDAETGKRIWHFQTIHHDVWDRDIPTPPVLTTITKDGKDIDVVIQTTKMGYIYVLDRETGEHIFPIQEREVPASQIPGEKTARTQPEPTEMPAFARQIFEPTNISDSSRAYVNDIISRTKHGDLFIPPSEEGTLIYPGYDGGGEWGGPAFNPETQTLFVNANEMPWLLTMIGVNDGENSNVSRGKGLYQQFCVGCHGVDRQGGEFMGQVPSLKNVTDRLEADKIRSILKNGQRAMPSFAFLDDWQVSTIIQYLEDADKEQVNNRKRPNRASKYVSTGYIKFKDQAGYPAIAPPWGTLTAIDIPNAKIKWQIPFGEHKELTAQGVPITGTENYGGPVVTSSGLLFIAATQDEKFRVVDQSNGEILWEYQLPAAGYATPSTYFVDGRQFVVIACGGGKLGTPSGDKYVAFALPRD